MRASRVGFASTYRAVVRIDVWPAICAIAFRSTPRSASRVIRVRRPLCEDAPATPASAYIAFRKRAIEHGVIGPPFWLANNAACDALALQPVALAVLLQNAAQRGRRHEPAAACQPTQPEPED